ncbi:MAG: hypothetical protein HY819_03705 [Acidobacteria bacterium]|nr:hypothetical protein [Acidobacteriota bacterium]
MSTKSWSIYFLLGNGWREPITQATLQHQVTNPDTKQVVKNTIGPVNLEEGDVSNVANAVTYEGQDDTWSISFYDSNNVLHSNNLQANIESEDANAILFSQVTSENNRWTLYFPVSSDSHTSI